MRIPYISLVAAGAVALGGCAYDGLGLGYADPYYSGYGYGSPYGYGYGGPSISVGIGTGYGGYYGSPYYGGYGYGMPYYGWYDNYYYPGSGYYVYDQYRRPFAMTSTQRQYWSTRSPALRTTTATRTTVRPNWSAFDQRREARRTAREERQQARDDRRTNRHNQ